MDAMPQETIFMTHRAKLFFILITLFALIYNCFLPLHPDEAYYWSWSRHLALSYFDGPPLIAYLIKLSTLILGNTAFAIKLVSVICLTLTAWLVHQFSRHLFDQKVAEVALILFLLIPFVQAGYLISTPDSPLILFWTATLYAFYLALNTQHLRYLYLTGLCAGLMLLSKYTGILLLAALFAYLVCSKHRRQLRNPHLYLAAILALIIFSPVIIWNWQHHWIGFAFQWHHGHANDKIFQLKYLGQYIGGQIGAFNPILFFALFVLIFRKRQQLLSNTKLYYLIWPFALTFLFFLYNSCFKKSEVNWPAPAYITAGIMLAYWFVTNKYRKTYIASIILGIAVVIVVKFPWVTPFMPNKDVLLNKFLGYQQLMQQAAPYYKPGDIVVSDSYQRASEASFYLPSQPPVYIITPTRFSQYTLWSQKLKQAIQHGKINSVLYIGDASQKNHLLHYFKSCQLLKHLNYNGQFKTRQRVLLKCQNP